MDELIRFRELDVPSHEWAQRATSPERGRIQLELANHWVGDGPVDANADRAGDLAVEVIIDILSVIHDTFGATAAESVINDVMADRATWDAS